MPTQDICEKRRWMNEGSHRRPQLFFPPVRQRTIQSLFFVFSTLLTDQSGPIRWRRDHWGSWWLRFLLRSWLIWQYPTSSERRLLFVVVVFLYAKAVDRNQFKTRHVSVSLSSSHLAISRVVCDVDCSRRRTPISYFVHNERCDSFVVDFRRTCREGRGRGGGVRFQYEISSRAKWIIFDRGTKNRCLSM